MRSEPTELETIGSEPPDDMESKISRATAARMACVFGIRDWHLSYFTRAELEEIIARKEYAGLDLSYPDNPRQGLRR